MYRYISREVRWNLSCEYETNLSLNVYMQPAIIDDTPDWLHMDTTLT